MRVDCADLLRKAVEGDDAALGDVLRAHEPEVRRHLAGRIPARFASLVSDDDIIQQTWTDVFLTIRKRRPEACGFLTWIKTIARNNLIEVLRALQTAKRGGSRRPVANDAGDAPRLLYESLTMPSGQRPSRVAARAENAEALLRAIARLSGAHAQVVRMYDLEGREIDEVAAAINRSPGAVYLLRNRAHRRLRELLGGSADFFTGSA